MSCRLSRVNRNWLIQRCVTHLCYQLSLYFQLLVQLVLPLFEGDAAAASTVFDPDAPVVYLLQEVARTQLVFNAQHSSSGGEDRDRRTGSRLSLNCLTLLSCMTICIHICISPVKVEDVVEDFRVPVKEELVALDDVVITQVQLPAVVAVNGQPSDPCLWIPDS